MDMTDSDDSDYETLIDLKWNKEQDLIKLRKQIDKMEQVIKYMERDNQEIWKLIEKIKENKKDIRL